MATSYPLTTTIDYHTHTLNSTYVQPAYPQGGYQCGNCGQWIYGYQQHNCYYYLPPSQTIIYQTVPVPSAQPTPDLSLQLKEVKEELKEVRNLLEKLMDLAVNDHEEVCGCDDGGGEITSPDLEGSFEGSIRIGYSPEAARVLGL